MQPPPSEHDARRQRFAISAALAICGLSGVWLSESREVYWLAGLILASDIFLVALLVILAEQIASAKARERRQLSLKKFFLVTAAICAYLSLARVAGTNLLIGQQPSAIAWLAIAAYTGIYVVVSFPIVLSLCEGLVWLLVGYQKRPCGHLEAQRVGGQRLYNARTIGSKTRSVAPVASNFLDVEKPMSADAKLAELKLELPPAPKPQGVYKPIVIVGNMAYVSGHGPLKPDGTLLTGRVGSQVDQQAGYAAARQTGLAILATLRANLGSLDRVQRVIKTLGMVNCTADFEKQPAVINGCSELWAEIFGHDNGVGARSAVGMGSLPGNISVEIEAIFEIV
jgi:enamine deaminase RidA (YjgF/YER057c/UK114 family)